MPNPYIHCVFDDCTADPHLHNSYTLNELAMYGRHYRCGSWINRFVPSIGIYFVNIITEKVSMTASTGTPCTPPSEPTRMWR